MQAILGRTRSVLTTVGDRASRSVTLLSVRDGIVAVLPFVLIGSFFYLLVEPPLVRASWRTAYATVMAHWIPLFVLVSRATTGMISLYAGFAIAYHLARRRELDPLAAGLIAVAADLAIVAPLKVALGAGQSPEWVLPLEKVGSAGLFLAILVALYTVEVQRILLRRNWVVRLPPSVPEAVSRSFLSLLPALFAVSSLWLLVHGFGFDLFGAIALLTGPLKAVGNSLPGILLVVLIDSVVWLFGIHALTILAVMKPIWLQMFTQNFEAAAAGLPIPNVAPREFYLWFVWMGGSGASLALAANMLLSRSTMLRSVAKVSTVPALFNISEPVMFGVPVVMNPTLAVPFVLAPFCCAVSAWVAFHFNMVTRPHLDVPWTLPAPIGAFLSTGDLKSLVLLALNFGMAFLIYAPFVRTYDRKLLAQEAAAPEPRPSNGSDRTQSPAAPGASRAMAASAAVADRGRS